MEVWDGKTIEVRGIKSATADCIIQLFFESRRKSGGDAVETIQRNTDHDVTYVTFEDPQGQCFSFAN